MVHTQSITQLDADALSLWIASLRNTLTIASLDGRPCLQDIFPDAMTLLAGNLDLLGSITRIIESYLLLDAVNILKVRLCVIMISLILTGSRVMPLICSNRIESALQVKLQI